MTKQSETTDSKKYLEVYGETVTCFRSDETGKRVIETERGIATNPDGTLKSESDYRSMPVSTPRPEVYLGNGNAINDPKDFWKRDMEIVRSFVARHLPYRTTVPEKTITEEALDRIEELLNVRI